MAWTLFASAVTLRPLQNLRRSASTFATLDSVERRTVCPATNESHGVEVHAPCSNWLACAASFMAPAIGWAAATASRPPVVVNQHAAGAVCPRRPDCAAPGRHARDLGGQPGQRVGVEHVEHLGLIWANGASNSWCAAHDQFLARAMRDIGERGRSLWSPRPPPVQGASGQGCGGT